MRKLTKRMHEVLRRADLKKGVVDDVPMSTADGLERRKLITSSWRKAIPPSQRRAPRIWSTAGGRFPIVSGVELTEEGLRAARTVQL